ncbi:MAG: exodeoxyribonuclease VII small subunit [Firmicutes bacterium]|nr:exodeoxyribonuclease VII small subunit [Bacillota bacterium]
MKGESAKREAVSEGVTGPVSGDDTVIAFEAAMTALEGVVRALESGELPLEAAIDQFQSGMRLVKMCRDQLEAAEQKVEMVLASEQGIVRKPFALEES